MDVILTKTNIQQRDMRCRVHWKSPSIFSEEKVKRYSTKFQIHNSFCSIFYSTFHILQGFFSIGQKIDIKSTIILMSMFLNFSEWWWKDQNLWIIKITTRLAHFNVQFLTCYSVELKSNNSVKLKIITQNLNRSEFFGEQEEFSKKTTIGDGDVNWK